MQINCPRCGFRQPKDQYCASCGVDMEAFKPREPAFIQKLLSSNIFQVSFVILIGAALALYIVNYNKPQTWVQRISRTQPVKNISENTEGHSNAHLREQGDETSAAVFENDSAPRSVEVEMSSAVQMAAFSSPPPDANPTETNPSTPNETQKNTATDEISLGVTFIEINREALAQWIQDSQSQGSFQNYNDDFSVGILSQFRKRSDLNFKVLIDTNKKLRVGRTEPSMYGRTQDSTSQFIGIQTNVSLKSIETTSIKGHFDLIRQIGNFKDSLPAEFELQKGAVLFLHIRSLILPFTSDRALTNSPPFDILKSIDYQGQKTELIIILEPK